MMKHLYCLSDEELLEHYAALRTGVIEPHLVRKEQRRYWELVRETVEANVLVLGPRGKPRELTKRDGGSWLPAEFAEQLRQHLQTLCPPKKKPSHRRRVAVDSDSEEPQEPRGGTRFVSTEAEDADGVEEESGEEEDGDDIDERGNLRGFVVPDSEEEEEEDMDSEPASSPVRRRAHATSEDAASPGAVIVGYRSRAERDAEGLANAINLLTPPRGL